MPHDRSSLKPYYGEAGLAKIEERSRHWSPEQQSQLADQMKQLFAEAEGVVGEDPASEAGQAIASRWINIAETFTGGDPDLMDGLMRFYMSRPSWPQEYQRYWDQKVGREVWDFVTGAILIRLGRPISVISDRTGNELGA